jgi:vacuolar-type H+-ATPase subunit I/STV1
MKKNVIIVFAMCLSLVAVQSCSSKPEQNLLSSYFNAISMNDISTMSSMALDPVKIEAESWKVSAVSEEKIEPAPLAELNKKELDLKKQVEQHVGPTLDAKDTLDVAKDDFSSARTGGARAAAKAKVDAAQLKYDEEYKIHQDLQKQYNEAKAAAQREEDLANFSLGVRAGGQIANLRELTGEVRTKDVEIEAKDKAGAIAKHRITMRIYTLKDETVGVTHRGQWKIMKIEAL